MQKSKAKQQLLEQI